MLQYLHFSQQKRLNHGIERLPPAKFSRALVAKENYNEENNDHALADKSFRSLPNSSTQERKYMHYIYKRNKLLELSKKMSLHVRNEYTL